LATLSLPAETRAPSGAAGPVPRLIVGPGRAWQHARPLGSFGKRAFRGTAGIPNMQVSATRAAVLGEYARLALQYDRRWSFYVRATARETLARFRLNPTDSALDVGCGTGALLHQLSASHPQARLAGIDPSPEMLAIARARLPPGIELKQSWAEGIPYTDEAFDVVVSCNVFHYIREPLDALTEMLRVLRPGGALVITDWCDDYLACRIYDWYLRHFDAAHFRTYPARRLKDLLRTAGAAEVRIDCYKITWLWGLMTATARKQVQPAGPAAK
jgi:ubiquinone/menaquinone biosynthesis C-methylase UbiE